MSKDAAKDQANRASPTTGDKEEFRPDLGGVGGSSDRNRKGGRPGFPTGDKTKPK